MIKEDYCSYELSKLLKEKGFNDEVRTYYQFDNETKEAELIHDGRLDTPNLWSGDYYSAPTHQMAMAWLREVHNILIWFSPVIPTPIPKDETVFYWKWKIKRKLHNYSHIQNHIKYETYEDAVEAALKYTLENLI